MPGVADVCFRGTIGDYVVQAAAAPLYGAGCVYAAATHAPVGDWDSTDSPSLSCCGQGYAHTVYRGEATPALARAAFDQALPCSGAASTGGAPAHQRRSSEIGRWREPGARRSRYCNAPTR